MSLLFLFLFRKFMCHFTKYHHHTITNIVVFSKAGFMVQQQTDIEIKRRHGFLQHRKRIEATKKISLYNLCHKIYNGRQL